MIETIVAIGAEVVSTVFSLVKSAFTAKAEAKAKIHASLVEARDALRSVRDETDRAHFEREKATAAALGERDDPTLIPEGKE